MPEVIIPGSEGRLEGRYHASEQPSAPAALILHPHPKHGGTMHNTVTYNLYKTFSRNGFSVLRFNFRGVGRSEGTFDGGSGELSDAATALDWLQANNPDAPAFWVAGFSFGAWLSLQLLMRRPELEGFVAVSPPANLYDFTFLSPCPRSGLMLQGDKDSIVSEEEVAKLAQRLTNQRGITIDYQVVPGADHFFRNTLDTMSARVHEYVAAHMDTVLKRGRTRPNARRRQLPKTA